VELNTKVSGSAMQETVLAFRFGRMGRNMKESGKIIKPMGKGSFGMSMETILKGFGRRIKLMDLEYIFIPMEQSMKEIGRMTFKMGLA
jgi:hypothetical protein